MQNSEETTLIASYKNSFIRYSDIKAYLLDKITQINTIIYPVIKRTIDIVVSLLVIMVFFPIIIYIALFIKNNSQGQIVFKQTRLKKNRRNNKHHFSLKYFFQNKNNVPKNNRRKVDLRGEPFTFYKFRTMYINSRKLYPELYAYNYSEDEIKKLKFKIKEDPRVPKWAKWLRKSSLDELPNFINVFLGDMSLVGPRPDIPEMVKYYTEEQKLKLKVKPGITGLAQIKGRGNLNFQETLKYDVEYVKNRSFPLDMKIIYKTILETFDGNGAY